MNPKETQEVWKNQAERNTEAFRIFIDGICEQGIGPFGQESNVEFWRSMAGETDPADLPYIREYKLYAGTMKEARAQTPAGFYPVLKTERWRNWAMIPQMFTFFAAKFVAGERSGDRKLLKLVNE